MRIFNICVWTNIAIFIAYLVSWYMKNGWFTLIFGATSVVMGLSLGIIGNKHKEYWGK